MNTRDVQVGDIIVYRGTSLISRLIRLFTRSPYTHVALAIGDGQIIEANLFVNTRVRELRASEVYEVYRVDGLDDVHRNQIKRFALHYKDYPYDYWQVLGIALRIIFETKENLFNRSNRIICSELIDLSYYCSEVPRALTYHVGDVSPSELLEVYKLRKK